jgi:hypothetical protein
MPTDLQQLASIKSDYLAALLADALNPRPDYSVDGQTVSRAQWRESLWAKVELIDKLIQYEDPFELRGQTT